MAVSGSSVSAVTASGSNIRVYDDDDDDDAR
jgi:hypothetical protein